MSISIKQNTCIWWMWQDLSFFPYKFHILIAYAHVYVQLLWQLTQAMFIWTRHAALCIENYNDFCKANDRNKNTESAIKRCRYISTLKLIICKKIFSGSEISMVEHYFRRWSYFMKVCWLRRCCISRNVNVANCYHRQLPKPVPAIRLFVDFIFVFLLHFGTSQLHTQHSVSTLSARGNSFLFFIE